jgi:hypothetical protein
MEEKVDVLLPPLFEKSGIIKTREQAVNDGDWIGVFHLWIIKREPVPSIIYQQRSFNASWEPGKLDVSSGGHYLAGEEIIDGLREVKEELGKSYDKDKVSFLGKRANVGIDNKKRRKYNIVNIFITEDNSDLNNYDMQKDEVHALVCCPIDEMIKVHSDKSYSYIAQGLKNDGTKFSIKVNQDSFPLNWDDYHLKMALIAERFVKGDINLRY